MVEGSALELPCYGGNWQVWTFNGTHVVETCGGYCTIANGSLVFHIILRQHQGLYQCLFGEVSYTVTVIG